MTGGKTLFCDDRLLHRGAFSEIIPINSLHTHTHTFGVPLTQKKQNEADGAACVCIYFIVLLLNSVIILHGAERVAECGR